MARRLRDSKKVRAALAAATLAERQKIGRDIARRAASDSPIDTGRFARSWATTTEGTTVLVGSIDFRAHWIEFGTAKMRPFAPLRGAIRAEGYKLTEAPKGRRKR